jgi:hypothetical protein
VVLQWCYSDVTVMLHKCYQCWVLLHEPRVFREALDVHDEVLGQAGDLVPPTLTTLKIVTLL